CLSLLHISLSSPRLIALAIGSLEDPPSSAPMILLPLGPACQGLVRTGGVVQLPTFIGHSMVDSSCSLGSFVRPSARACASPASPHRNRMIRVAHFILTADTRAGGTTTAFFNILQATNAFSEELAVTSYFERPPQGDPAWETINRAADRFKLANKCGRKLVP